MPNVTKVRILEILQVTKSFPEDVQNLSSECHGTLNHQVAKITIFEILLVQKHFQKEYKIKSSECHPTPQVTTFKIY